ncbi:MAG TPA: c-type cytochrome, partial [Verrucomicrobiae bacterium]
AAVFNEHCAGCHRINGNGGLIGPQLDGIGARGVERLCEDILDPNRNVDSHFFLHLFKLRDGSTLGGFVRGEAGQVLLIADASGQEQRIAKADVVEDNVTAMSLMPPAFAQAIPEQDFYDLLAFLLTSGPAGGKQ